MDYKAFERICAERGVAPSRVAKDLGMSSGSASFWKKGGNPSEKTVRRLADYLGVTVADLEEKPKFSYSYDEMKEYVTEFLARHDGEDGSKLLDTGSSRLVGVAAAEELRPDEEELLRVYRSLSRSKQLSLIARAYEWAEEASDDGTQGA
jgi:transcriptional regulator with XRE-family HTH domain